MAYNHNINIYIKHLADVFLTASIKQSHQPCAFKDICNGLTQWIDERS